MGQCISRGYSITRSEVRTISSCSASAIIIVSSSDRGGVSWLHQLSDELSGSSSKPSSHSMSSKGKGKARASTSRDPEIIDVISDSDETNPPTGPIKRRRTSPRGKGAAALKSPGTVRDQARSFPKDPPPLTPLIDPPHRRRQGLACRDGEPELLGSFGGSRPGRGAGR
jgi:hypothetical protein